MNRHATPTTAALFVRYGSGQGIAVDSDHGGRTAWRHPQRWRVAAWLLGAAASTSIGAASAHAAAVGHARVYQSQELCVANTTTTSSGPNYAGYSDVANRSETEFWAIQCLGWFTRPPGYMADLLQYWWWNYDTGQWTLCLDSGWYYNDQQTDYYELEWTFDWPPCGNGWYGTIGHTYVWNGDWRGGYTWSGAYLITILTGPQGTAAPPPPAWVRPDGGIDVSKIPPNVPVFEGGTTTLVPSQRVFGPPPPGPASATAGGSTITKDEQGRTHERAVVTGRQAR
jgi:hypothetical protein